ncbi:YCF48-related protein [uncultured Endozoicomonas sp.]|uniref:WD40/YVTN/BNR-like repeat-containing protein n=1 Tax=uncultured Endozoicomonas sp. TaxID=432652 RepID=UPI00263A0089|nr:YCF48-related protein [uncultured Endozoicomonas sp.]
MISVPGNDQALTPNRCHPAFYCRLLSLFAAFCGLLFTNVSTAQASETEYAIISDMASQSLLLDITLAPESVRLITVGDRGHILYSDDHGSNWQQAKVPTQQMLTAVYFPSSSTGYAVGHDALILKTVDAGDSWHIVYEDRALEAPLLDVWFENETRGIAVGAFGTLLSTDDGGKSWTDRTYDLDNEDGFHYNAIAGDGEGNVYLVGETGLLFHSSDNGDNWNRLDSIYQGSLFGVSADKKRVMVFGLRGNAFLSTDKGDNWQPISTNLQETLFGSTILNNGQAILVGNAGAIVKESQSEAWLATNRSNRQLLNALAENALGQLIAVGQGGIHRLDSHLQN